MYFQLLILALLLAISCAKPSITKKAPKELKELYLKAKSLDDQNACPLYKKLYSNKDFPLKHLSLIRVMKTCSFSRAKTMALIHAIEKKDLPEYVKEEFYLEGFEKLKHFNATKEASRFAIEVSKRQRTSKEEENWLLTSVQLAKKSKNKEAIRAANEALQNQFPSYLDSPTPQDFYSVARDWEKKREFKKARHFYKKAFHSKKLSSTERIDAHFRYAFTYRLDRDRKTYAKKFSNMVKWMRKHFGKEVESTTDKDLLEAYWARYILEAKSYWNIGDYDTCYKKLQSLASRTPNGKYKAEVLWTLGKMHLEKEQLKEALSYYQKAFDVQSQDEEINGKIIWSLVWNHYLQENYQQALEVINKSEIENPYVQAKLDFWKGRVLLKLDKKKEVKEVFSKLTQTDPYGFYGISAHYFLDKKLKAIHHSAPETTLHYQELDWLNLLEEKDLSRRFLEDVGEKMTEPEEISNLLPLYTESEFYSGGLLKFFKIPPEKRDLYLEKHLTTVFPLAYLEIAQEESKKRSVPTPLIMGMIRQESAFDTYARSWADAFGLMQLLPERAKELSRKIEVPYSDFNDLYDPKTNIQLGTLLLSQYLKNWDHNFIGYIASYNAGSGAIKRWLRVRYRKDPFEFVEMIPYEETQGYIKLIFRNYVTYMRLTGHNVNIDPSFLWNSKVSL